jgi:histidinol-phosphate aminotransferase
LRSNGPPGALERQVQMSEITPILLDRNENRYGPAPACLDVLRQADPELLFNYTRAFERGAYSDLSVRLAELHGLGEQQIILGYGCEDLLKEAVHHFLHPGRTILIPQASWWYYKAIADEVGGVTVEYPLVASPARYEFDLEALLRLRESVDPALVLIASPNNPTGNVLSREDLLRVLDHFQDVPLVLDQAYFGLTPGEVDDFAALTRRYPNLLILRTFSKLYALAGARIGYGILGDGLPGFRRFCARNLGYNRLSEQLALAALDSPAFYEDLARRLAADRRRFYRLFRACPGCEVYESEANFLLVKLPAEAVPGLKEDLVRQGLVIKFFKEPAFIDHARISLGTEAENARLIAAIGRFFQRHGELAAAAGGEQ